MTKPTVSPPRSAAAGIPMSVKVRQNRELRSYLADKDDRNAGLSAPQY
jgi:hypothetical protein